MKYDMDLVRKLLLWCEDNLPDKVNSVRARDLIIDAYSPDQIVYHVGLMTEAGFLKVIEAHSFGGENYLIQRLTYSGVEFLEGIKSDTVWNGVKEESEKIGIKIFTSVIPVILQIISKQAGLI
jgi:hypothetical protein